ncbi:hypothetical protein BD779DRAFT_1572099 [Infundibulicybe gibba]|nr:hypothetical protein BD779DRAFT_1572099 [Infundibulicybe gibba]
MTSIVVGFLGKLMVSSSGSLSLFVLESHPYPTLEEFLHEVKRQSRLSEQVRKAVGSQLNNDKYLASSTPQLSGLYPLEMRSRLQL